MFQLQQFCSNYNMKICVEETETVAFMGKCNLLTKIVTDNMCTKQMTHFGYLGCDTTYDVEYDVDQKLVKFPSICGTIRKALLRKTRKEI